MPDEAEIVRALLGSIEKWKAIVDGTGVDDGPHNCPLCQLFIEHVCDDCPVAESAEQPYCDGTPYIDYCDEPSTENAQKELDFLRSLLVKRAGRT